MNGDQYRAIYELFLDHVRYNQSGVQDDSVVQRDESVVHVIYVINQFLSENEDYDDMPPLVECNSNELQPLCNDSDYDSDYDDMPPLVDDCDEIHPSHYYTI